MAGGDTKTRARGVYARHQAHCAIQHGDGRSCRPDSYGAVYDPVKTQAPRHPRRAAQPPAPTAAVTERGELSAPHGISLRTARERFVTAIREGRALNNQARPYKPSAIGMFRRGRGRAA